jgi:hypothetical protein
MKQIICLTILSTLFAINVFAQTEVSIYPQSDSPLLLSNIVPKWRKSIDDRQQEWNMLSVEFISQNVSDKTIRSYAIRQFSGDFDKDLGLVQFSFTLKDSGLSQPNQLINEEIGEEGFSKLSLIIKIAVDFVEFTDGSTWGNDLSNSAQQLAGVKAGVKAFLEQLNEIKKQNGIQDVIKTLDETNELLPPDDKSGNWKRGFRSGANAVKRNIKRAYEKEGINGIESELQKSFNIFPSN